MNNVSQCIVSVQLMTHFFLAFLVKCHIIKLYHFNVTLGESSLTRFQMLMEGLKPPTHHQLCRSQTIHWWLRSRTEPINVKPNGNDRIEQVPRKHFSMRAYLDFQRVQFSRSLSKKVNIKFTMKSSSLDLAKRPTSTRPANTSRIDTPACSNSNTQFPFISSQASS